MSEKPDPQTDVARIRRNRNIVLGLLLSGFAVLIFFISIAKMS